MKTKQICKNSKGLIVGEKIFNEKGLEVLWVGHDDDNKPFIQTTEYDELNRIIQVSCDDGYWLKMTYEKDKIIERDSYGGYREVPYMNLNFNDKGISTNNLNIEGENYEIKQFENGEFKSLIIDGDLRINNMFDDKGRIIRRIDIFKRDTFTYEYEEIE